jgi:hypothetical protein
MISAILVFLWLLEFDFTTQIQLYPEHDTLNTTILFEHPLAILLLCYPECEGDY